MRRDLVEQRRASVPEITYPDQLPIVERRRELLDTIRDHQVVVIAGETGSGKSTQIPKFCLELGRGIDAMIGHTQPRRLAARSIATRVADELGTEVGDLVGYSVRFTDEVSDRTLVKAMTTASSSPNSSATLISVGTTRSSSTKPTSGRSTSTSCSATCADSSNGATTFT